MPRVGNETAIAWEKSKRMTILIRNIFLFLLNDTITVVASEEREYCLISRQYKNMLTSLSWWANVLLLYQAPLPRTTHKDCILQPTNRARKSVTRIDFATPAGGSASPFVGGPMLSLDASLKCSSR